jgi:hypothetical protein
MNPATTADVTLTSIIGTLMFVGLCAVLAHRSRSR